MTPYDAKSSCDPGGRYRHGRPGSGERLKSKPQFKPFPGCGKIRPGHLPIEVYGDDAFFTFEERAAIMEYDGNMVRCRAEAMAWKSMHA